MDKQSLAKERASIEKAYETSGPEQVGPETKTQRVLVIDDDAVMRKLLLEMLSPQYTVLASSHGLELPKLLGEFKPHLVLLDVMMPWVNGMELCRLIKSHPNSRDVPVMFVSGKKRPEDIRSGLREGADAYVTKPFTMADLLAQIKSLLEKSPR